MVNAFVESLHGSTSAYPGVLQVECIVRLNPRLDLTSLVVCKPVCLTNILSPTHSTIDPHADSETYHIRP